MSKDVELSVQDRLILMGLLPGENDFVTLRIVRDLKNDLGFSEAEVAICQFRQEGSMIVWDKTANGVKKLVTLGDKALEIVRGSLEHLSTNRQATEPHLQLWELLFGGDE